jgi:hypothetical protein
MRARTWVGTVSVVALALTVAAGAQVPRITSMNEIAERYVRLVLAVGQHDADYVDAFYGPADWKEAAARDKRPLAALADEAGRLIADMPAAPSGDADQLATLRREYLLGQLRSLQARVRMLQGTRLTFDEESKALYDAVAPTRPASHFDRALSELDALLPGSGSLIERVDRFRHDFIIPTDRLARVFDRTIDECRSRTRAHIELPAGESFRVEYVTNKAWSGYNWYQGQYHSLIQVNTDLPIYVDRAVDLACHEGYPGHHIYNVRLEQHLVRDRGWIEYTIYPLFSPQSLIAEGTANYGIDVAFPGEERTAFERDVVFPLAGLDSSRAAAYAQVLALIDRLSYAGNEAARSYLNGRMDRGQAAEWLTKYALMSPPRAEQRVRFFDQYRSYVINYNLGKDLVKAHIESRAGRSGDTRWQVFTELISSPRLPSGLRPAVHP